MMTLYGYWRSSASYRVRLALHYKQLDFNNRSVHLVKDGGQQHQTAYREINPVGLVPTLTDGKFKLNQSLAIIDYLEHRFTDSPRLLPNDGMARSLVLAVAYDLAMDLQPVTNLRVLQRISDPSLAMTGDKPAWIKHWVEVTFSALEEKLQDTAGDYCFGDSFSLADVCLLPQIYNALRFDVPLTDYPRITSIHQHCMTQDFVTAAYPDNQPDAVS